MAVARAKLPNPPALESREELRRAYQALVDGVDVEVSGYNEVSVADAFAVELVVPEMAPFEDDVSVVDAVEVNFGVTFTKNDSAGTSDAFTVESAYVPPQVTIADTVSISEVVLVEKLDTEAFNDTIGVTDVYSLVVAKSRRVDDTLSAVDTISAQGSASAPTVTLLSPAQGATRVAPDEPLVIRLTNGLGVSLSTGNIRVTVNAQEVWNGSVSAAGWTGHFVEVTSGTFILTLYPTQGFAYGQHITIQVDISYGAQAPVVESLSAADAVTIEVNP